MCSYSLEAFNKGKRAVTAQNKGSFAIDPIYFVRDASI